MPWDVKITVLKRTLNADAAERYAGGQWGPCGRFAEGQTFVVGGKDLSSAMPAGFCSWAWADIHQFVLALARGANFVGAKPGTFVSCCTDGYRPVIFALERVQADDGE